MIFHFDNLPNDLNNELGRILTNVENENRKVINKKCKVVCTLDELKGCFAEPDGELEAKAILYDGGIGTILGQNTFDNEVYYTVEFPSVPMVIMPKKYVKIGNF